MVGRNKLGPLFALLKTSNKLSDNVEGSVEN
jgi:hypothetical protein